MDANNLHPVTNYLYDQIVNKRQPFTYDLYLEAVKIERSLIIDTFNEGATHEALGFNPASPHTSAGEEYYTETEAALWIKRKHR